MKRIYPFSRMKIGDTHVFRCIEHYIDRRRVMQVAHNTNRKKDWKFSVKTKEYSLTVKRIK